MYKNKRLKKKTCMRNKKYKRLKPRTCALFLRFYERVKKQTREAILFERAKTQTFLSFLLHSGLENFYFGNNLVARKRLEIT